MRYIIHIITITAIIFTGCTSSEIKTDEKTPAVSLMGEWELSKEIVNGKTLDCSEEEIKTILSFTDQGYFVYFDDLSNSGLGAKIAKMQTHYKGQYLVEGDTLSLSYTDDAEDYRDDYSIKTASKKELVLVSLSSTKEIHYIKR